MIWAFVNWTVGASTTATQFRIRRGTTITAPSITANTTITSPAGTFAVYTIVYVDSPGAVAGVQYSLTAAQIGGSGSAPISDICILAVAL